MRLSSTEQSFNPLRRESYRVDAITFLMTRRHTNESLFTFMTLVRRLCLITIGKLQVLSFSDLVSPFFL